MNFIQIKETCLYVTDLEKTENFYCGKLGLKKIGYRENSHVFFKVGSSVLLCFIVDSTKNKTNLPPHHGKGHIHFAFGVKVDEYEKCKSDIIAASIEIEHEQEWWDNFLSFYFRDPDEHLVEVVMEGMWKEKCSGT